METQAVLTFYCYTNKLSDMHNLIEQFLQNQSLGISAPMIDTKNNRGYVEVTLSTEKIEMWHNTIPLVVNQLIMNSLEPGLPTIEEWCRALITTLAATKVELSYKSGTGWQWELDLASNIATDKGQILYRPGREG